MFTIKIFFNAKKRGLKSRLFLVCALTFAMDINENGIMCSVASVCEYMLSFKVKMCKSPEMEKKRFTGLQERLLSVRSSEIHLALENLKRNILCHYLFK